MRLVALICLFFALDIAPGPGCGGSRGRPGGRDEPVAQPAVATPAPSPPADAADIPTSPAQPGLLSEAEFAALHELTQDQAPPARGTELEVGGARAYLSLPKGATGPVPAVLVIHEWWGLNDNIRHWADRLADAGYAALAVDLYGGTVATNREEAMAAMKSVDEAAATAILQAAHAFLESDERIRAPRTGVIGWCFGGGWSLKTAMRVEGIDAAVVYYGHIPPPTEAASLKADVFGVFGSQDQGIPLDGVREFAGAAERAGHAFAVNVYDAPHAFANPSNARYDKVSAEDAWDKVQAFLKGKLRD